MALSITVQQDLPKASAWAKRIGKQLPFATSLALNNTGFDVRKSLNESTKGVFHVPVRFTQTAFLVKKSKKSDLTALVFANDQQGKDRARYLRFGAAGGARPQKGMDLYFGGRYLNDGTIPAGAYFMPTSLVKTNRSGNITVATLRRIAKQVNTGKAFVGTPTGGGRPPGVYQRDKAQLKPLFIATTARPKYQSIFDIEGIGSKVVERRFNQHFDAALARAMQSAR